MVMVEAEVVYEDALEVRGCSSSGRFNLRTDHAGCDDNAYYVPYGNTMSYWERIEGYQGMVSVRISECPTCKRKSRIRIPSHLLVEMRLTAERCER